METTNQRLYGAPLPAVMVEGQEVRGITVRTSSPPKTAVLRLPTAAEILERLDDQKSIRKSIGRRKYTTEVVPNGKADIELFNAIRLDKGPEFDEFECAKAIGKLTYCEVTDCERVGEDFRVTLKTPFADTTHLVKVPSDRDTALYRKAVISSTDLPRGMEELRYRITPSVELYDKVLIKATGYAEGTPVPPHHASAVVLELINASDDLGADISDPNS